MADNAFTVTIEPVAACNLDCRYCYSTLQPAAILTAEVALRALRSIAAYAADHGFDELHCIWHGGEPLLAGIQFFERIFSDVSSLKLPQRHFVQTNGLLLDRDFCRLFRDSNISLGVSIDGPRHIHDTFRVASGGEPTHSRVMDAIGLLRKYNVSFGCVAVVSSAMLGREREVYTFFRSLGSGFRINPVIPGRAGSDPSCQVQPAAYGAALIRFFDAWVASYPEQVDISPLDSYLAAVAGGQPSECQHKLTCADRTVGIKPDGTATICARFQDFSLVHLGPSFVADLFATADATALQARAGLIEECHRCINWAICHGGCPQNAAAFGRPVAGKDPFCPAYKAIFAHIRAALGAGATA
jgi:uncharacterized protein